MSHCETVGAPESFVHATAFVEADVHLGAGVKVWHHCHVRCGARLNAGVSLGKGVFVDEGVEIGEGSRIQNGVSIYRGVHIGSWALVGPHVIFTNDQFPRVGKNPWKLVETWIENGCSIGAGSVLRCGVRLGAFSMTGAGSVVTRPIAPFTLAMGTPARMSRRICACGDRQDALEGAFVSPFCDSCASVLPEEILRLAECEYQRSLRDRSFDADPATLGK